MMEHECRFQRYDTDRTGLYIMVIILLFAADCNDTKIQKNAKTLQRIEQLLTDRQQNSSVDLDISE